MTDPAQETEPPNASGQDNTEQDYHRIATIGSQQLQARIITPYYGLNLDDIMHGTTVFR